MKLITDQRPVRVIGAPHLFIEHDRIDRLVPEGMTIVEAERACLT